MAPNGIQSWAIVLLALLFCCAAIRAEDANEVDTTEPESNVQASVEAYILQNQRDYANVLHDFQSEINGLSVDFFGVLELVDGQFELLQNLLRQSIEKLYSLEVLGETSRNCVQKHQGGLVSIESVQKSVKECIDPVKYWSNSWALENTKVQLENYYKGEFKSSLDACRKENASSEEGYTNCVLNAISKAHSETIRLQSIFADQLGEAKCSSNNRLQSAMRCTFMALYHAINTEGRITGNVEECISNGLALQPPVGGRTCEHVVSVNLPDVDFQKETIPNPLHGYDGDKLSCLYLEFLNNSSQPEPESEPNP